ncbi:hypothetical protein B4U80_14237 [Leptotrombidium deliense]|uniref:C2H2-type domain-containing protein n=1 Tax=Leptotrombidium deliense TaxID=299467 RepID=A0A443RZI8_9ACAR|nr:hypothetical protein B4U80_14237 [Leptotrombidium deliense]
MVTKKTELCKVSKETCKTMDVKHKRAKRNAKNLTCRVLRTEENTIIDCTKIKLNVKKDSKNLTNNSPDAQKFKMKIFEMFEDKISLKMKKGVKKYKCNLCTKIFNTSLDVESHIQNIHRIEKSIKNSTVNKNREKTQVKCKKPKIRRDNSKIDNQFKPVKLSGVQKYKCNRCKKIFKAKSVHDVEVYKCDLCWKIYKSEKTKIDI